MNPAEIRALRGQRIFAADPYAAEGAVESISDRGSDLRTIRESCAELGKWLDGLPAFSSSFDYRWARLPDSYDLVSEAAWQRRLTVMMMSFWNLLKDKDGLGSRLDNIVVVQNFITKFGVITPRVKLVDGGRIKVIEVPAGFFEFDSWMNVGLRCWCSFHLGSTASLEGDAGWSVITAPIVPSRSFPANHVTIFELIARTLAEPARDRRLRGENAALVLREQVPWLAGPTGDLDPKGMKAVEQDMSYLVAEFILAHELGHIISGKLRIEASQRDYESEETFAHQAALYLLEVTAATRQFDCEPPLFEPMAQSALCMALFEYFVRCRVALVSLTTERVCQPQVRIQNQLFVEDRTRLRLATKLLDDRVHALRQDGHLRASQLISNLRNNGLGYCASLQATMVSMPNDVFAAAARILEQIEN